MAVPHLDPEDFGATVRELAAELLCDSSSEALERFRQLVEAFTRPETPPPGGGPGGCG